MTTLSREHFEDRVYNQFFIKSVKFTEGEQFAESTKTTKAELCKRGNDGDYINESISAMWFGYQLAMKAAKS